MVRYRSWALAILTTVALSLWAGAAMAASYNIELEFGDSYGNGAIVNDGDDYNGKFGAFAGKYYVQDGTVYRITYTWVSSGAGTTENYREVHTAMGAADSLNFIQNTTVSGYEGSATGNTGTAGEMVMTGPTNSITVNDAQSNINTDFIMGTTGSNNSLNFQLGTQGAGSDIKVGDGTITIGSGGNRPNTVLNGTVSTDKGNSVWNIINGTINGSFIAEGTGTGDTFTIGGNAQFAGAGNITLDTQGNSIDIFGTTNFTGNSQIDVNTNSNVIDIYGDATFDTSAAINVSGDSNQITVGGDAIFGTGTSIAVDANGQNNVIRVEGDAQMQAGSTISILGGSNEIQLYQGNQTANDAKVVYSGNIIMNGGGNTLDVGANTLVDDNTSITMDALGNNIFKFHEWSKFDGKTNWQNVQGDGNRLEIYEAADFSGAMNFTGGGTVAIVNLTQGSDGFPAPNMTGQIVFANTVGAGANTVLIQSGTLTSQYGSVIASNVVDTDVWVTSGTANSSKTNLMVSGIDAASTTTYHIQDGDVFNIREQTAVNFNGADWVATYASKDALNAPSQYVPGGPTTIDATGHSVIYGGGAQTVFQSYSILNVELLATTQAAGNVKTITSIGGFFRNASGFNDGALLGQTIHNQFDDYPAWGQGAYGNQVTADNIFVSGNTKLILHEDKNHLGLDITAVPVLDRTIANTTIVQGELTIDRGSIHGSTGITASIVVENDGILYGFGQNEYLGGAYGNHWDQYEQLRAQLYGNLYLDTGATLQPYDLGLSSYYFKGGVVDPTKVNDGLFYGWDYNTYQNEHRGSVFQVDDETGNGGTTAFMHGSIMRSRLFNGLDGREVTLVGQMNDDGTTDMDTQYSDSLLTVAADFSNVLQEVKNNGGNTLKAQAAKVQYDPVFGFHYDVKSKQEFQIYEEEGFQDKTYYYAVVNTQGNAITELNGYDDANHLFNKLILKSDMLGKYDFLKSDTDDSIYLRYRMLAYHPTEGGIKRTMEEYGHRNEIVPAQYLDEIRYPFRGQPGSDLNGKLSIDPSEDVVGDGYNKAGYNGNMQDFYYYATRKPGDPDHDPALYNPVFDNYKPEWIDDWANLFQGIQLAVGDNKGLYRAVRMLHAETYANVSQTAFDVMNQFTRNRERNAVSALFQVENDLFEDAMNEVEGADAYASLTDMDRPDFYVCNPTRFWASGFGAYGRQMRTGASGEMGYDTTVWGGAVGVIQELGDFYIGGTIGYADSETKYGQTAVKSKSYIAEGLVGARIFGLGFAEVYASYSFNENRNSRVVDLAGGIPGGYYGVATGEFDSQVYNLGFRLGYQKVLGDNWLFIPTIGFNVMHHRGESFTESGRANMANRMVFDKSSMDRTLFRVPIEFRLNRAIALGKFVLMPEIRAGFTPLLGDTRGEVKAKWIGNPINNRYFTSIGASRGSYEGWVGATFELSRRGRFYAAANYDFVYGANYTSHNYSIQAGMNF